MTYTLEIVTVSDAICCLRDDYDVSTIGRITVRPGLVLTADQQTALVKLRARIRKRKSRQGKTEILLPLPKGTGEALERVMQAAGFDDPRDFIAFQIHRLDKLRERDGHSFKAQAVRTVTVGDLSRYTERLGERHDVRRLASGEYACSCGRQWDADEGDECPGVGL
jgi:hypothetical protein